MGSWGLRFDSVQRNTHAYVGLCVRFLQVGSTTPLDKPGESGENVFVVRQNFKFASALWPAGNAVSLAVFVRVCGFVISGHARLASPSAPSRANPLYSGRPCTL